MMLETRGLTMRFGGLTAINAVDLKVERGQIFSVIGPNGAGKTTLFNAITGIYEPTEGQAAFEGHPLRKPLNGKVILGCLLMGCLTGFLAALLAVNVNKLWYAAVFRTAVGTSEKFSYDRMFAGTRGFLTNDLVVERIPRSRRYRVVPADYSDSDKIPMVLVETSNEADAGTARERLTELRNLAGDPQIAPAAEEGKWDIQDSSRRRSFAVFDSREEAATFIDHFAMIRRNGEQRPRTAMIALIAGFVVGGLGAFAVWNRSRRTADYIAHGGIARTFQNIRLFQNMTVLENILVGMDRRFRSGAATNIIRLPVATREEHARISDAQDLLEFVSLSDRAGMLAKNLPYGDQRKLEIARALAAQPKLLLLDEPAAGMNPRETVDLMALIRRIRERGITILLIEHHMSLVMGISDRIAVLDHGVKIAEGTAKEVKNNPKVIEAYLGREEVS